MRLLFGRVVATYNFSSGFQRRGVLSMKILNEKLRIELEQKYPVKLDLGCGNNAREGFYAVDHIELAGVDVIADLNEPLDLLPNDCCDYIYSHHAFEHINNFMSLMREIHRVTISGGAVEIVVPHFSNVYGYSDPTHVRFFGLYSMYYFVSQVNQPKIRKVQDYYSDFKFLVRKIDISFYRHTVFDKIFAAGLSGLINRNIKYQDFYERRLSALFPASSIRYLLSVVKNV